MDIRNLLEEVKNGDIDIDLAIDKLKDLPYEDIGYANIDHHRQIRNGYPEVIYCEGKSDEHILGIIKRMKEKGSNILGTRCRKDTYEKVK
ncbi:MAG: 1-(5-phosphoribosyl)-5-amino-4-imidazole-carboxylate carboxylase, partial [Paeniclostridium sp.]